MKKLALAVLCLSMVGALSAQNQLRNGGFESWDGESQQFEPTHWNSTLTASGSGLAYKFGRVKQFEKSQDVRPGTSGKYSLLIKTVKIQGTLINGCMSTGQFNVQNLKASHCSNHTITRTDNALYNEPFTEKPKAVRFWAKFESQDASMNAFACFVLHDNYNYCVKPGFDKESAKHVVAEAYSKINGKEWKEYTVPLEYGNSSLTPAFMHVLFMTNENEDLGNEGDRLLVDDIEFIY